MKLPINLPSVLSGLSSRLTGSSLVLPGRCKVAVSFLKSSGRFTLGMSIPTSHGLFIGYTSSTGCSSTLGGTSTPYGLSGTGFPSLRTFTLCGPSSCGMKGANRLSSDVFLSVMGSSTVDPGRSRPASSLGRSFAGMFSRGIFEGLPISFLGSGAVTITENGLPGIGRFRFLTVIKCSPGDLGTNDTLRLPSDKILGSTGSSTFEPGLFKVAVSLGKSSGLMSPTSIGTSQGAPTAYSGCAGSTNTQNGLSGISLPDFFTRIKCSPGSFGTKETPIDRNWGREI